MAEKRIIQFPPVEDLKARISAEKHVIQFTDDHGKTRQISLSVIKSAAYAVFGHLKLPEKFLSSGAPTVVNANGTVVVETDWGPAIGVTNVAVAQANGS